jgi:hypothetical protein
VTAERSQADRSQADELRGHAMKIVGKMADTDTADLANRAKAASDLMRAAAMAFEMDERVAPAAVFEHAEAFEACAAVLIELEEQFRAAGTETALRLAQRIKGTLDRYGIALAVNPS